MAFNQKSYQKEYQKKWWKALKDDPEKQAVLERRRQHQAAYRRLKRLEGKDAVNKEWREWQGNSPKSAKRAEKDSVQKRDRYKNMDAAERELYQRKRVCRSKGITVDEYNTMHAAQGGMCAICRKPETHKKYGKVVWLSIDHCHDTNRVRGLLCNNCNRALGFLDHDPQTLQRGAEYLLE